MALRALSLCSKSSLVRILRSTSGEWAGDARAGANKATPLARALLGTEAGFAPGPC